MLSPTDYRSRVEKRKPHEGRHQPEGTVQAMHAELLGQDDHQQREECADEQPNNAARDRHTDVAANVRQNADERPGNRHAAGEQEPLRNDVEVGEQTETDPSDDVRESEYGDEERGTGLGGADRRLDGVVRQHDVDRRVAGEDQHRAEGVDEKDWIR